MPDEESWEEWVAALSSRSRKMVFRRDIMNFDHLCSMTEKDLLKQCNFGKLSLAEIKEKLAGRGLSLAADE